MVVAEEETGRRISCLVADAFLLFSGDMAEAMRVPWVPLWTSAACSPCQPIATLISLGRLLESMV
ncbi:hypothetical protein ACSBR1_025981 [Camellia fascicularis]